VKDELKPCPFCGQEKPSLWQAGGYWKVKCVDGCSLSITGYMNKAGAIAAWNRRPAEKIQEPDAITDVTEDPPGPDPLDPNEHWYKCEGCGRWYISEPETAFIHEPSTNDRLYWCSSCTNGPQK